MMKIKLLIVSLLIFTMAGMAQAVGSTKQASLDTEFDLRPGGQANVKTESLKIQFGSVTEDSRCPEGVDCIWAGNGKISVTVRKGKHKAVTFTLNTMTAPKAITYRGYEIELVKLAPYPKKDMQIKKGNYVATLVVRRMSACN